MELLWLFWIPQDRLDFYGALLGGVIGFGGTYLAAWVTIRATRKHDQEKAEQLKQRNEQKKEEEKILSYRRARFLAEASLQEYLTQLFANIRFAQGCAQAAQEHAIMTNLPRIIPFDMTIMHDFRNLELVNKWLRLGMQIQLVNNMTDDFRIYYRGVTEGFDKVRLYTPKNEELSKHANPDAIVSGFETIRGYSLSVMQAAQSALDETFGALAVVDLHARLPDDKFHTVSKLTAYHVSLSDYEDELGKLHQRFDPEKMFTTIARS